MLTIDVFTHFMPPRFLEAFQATAPDQGMFRRSMQVKPLCELDPRLRLMDAFDDYTQVLSLGSPPIETFAGPDTSPELARIGNDGLAELVASHPDRFLGFLAALPMNNPDAALAEAERATSTLGAAGFQIYSNVAGRPLDDPMFTPIFEWTHAADVPIFLHPARSERFADYATEEKSKFEVWWTLGWPYETSTAMARLVFSGAFDRWPNLMVVTHHLGGIIPYVAGRVGHGWDQLGKRTSDQDYFALLKSLKKRPIDYFKMFYADTAEFGALAPTRCGLDFFGVDHVLFASDCPYEPESGIYVRETFGVMRQLGLPDADLAKICHGNAVRLMPGLRRRA
jgi:predicted TIM-barrel fold metal-dependent hydrolase